MAVAVLKIVCGQIITFDGIPAIELFKSETRVLFECADQWFIYKIDEDILYRIIRGDIYRLLLKLIGFGIPTTFKVSK